MINNDIKPQFYNLGNLRKFHLKVVFDLSDKQGSM